MLTLRRQQRLLLSFAYDRIIAQAYQYSIQSGTQNQINKKKKGNRNPILSRLHRDFIF